MHDDQIRLEIRRRFARQAEAVIVDGLRLAVDIVLVLQPCHIDGVQRLDVFARREREGWTAWGNEVPRGDEE